MLGASNGYNLVERLKLSFLSILLMVPMYLVVYYEYLVSVVGLISIKKIMSERKKGTFNCEWNPVERSGSTTFIGG